MMLYRCNGCGRKAFGKRKVCPSCHGESFGEYSTGENVPVASTRLTVTPAGFEDGYELILAECSGSKVLFRRSGE
ncbi:MAG TPA: hypothetical protein VJ944_01125 [Thermoplasmataceae archaeon]|nr:hypothetical protein [Thermoplasmataceae archaeon]